ncbi:MAG: hypothetical protein K8R67_15640 [Desulfobacteraceae bacterium]|nr:hypothetical protein [Desulfobacteraceae bacterium]
MIKATKYLQVESDANADFDSLKKRLSKIKNFNFEDYEPYNELQELILKHGISKIINPKYREAVGRPRDDIGLLIKTFQKFIDNVINTDKLIVIDNYIFPKSYDAEYPDLIINILKKYLPKLNNLTFITKRQFNDTLQTDIFNRIKNINNNITIDLKHTEHFHDRFWLSCSESKGAFIGTSLNGLGNKFTLIDYIDNNDVIQIFNELKNENLITL